MRLTLGDESPKRPTCSASEQIDRIGRPISRTKRGCIVAQSWGAVGCDEWEAGRGSKLWKPVPVDRAPWFIGKKFAFKKNKKPTWTVISIRLAFSSQDMCRRTTLELLRLMEASTPLLLCPCERTSRDEATRSVLCHARTSASAMRSLISRVRNPPVATSC
jgi:hypothetical protein